MRIKIGYGRIEELGASNRAVKFELSMETDVADGDWVQEAEELKEMCQKYVHDELDTLLEKEGREPKYYRGPLYALLFSPSRKTVLLVNDSDFGRYGDDWESVGQSILGRVPARGRYETMRDHGRIVANLLGWPNRYVDWTEENTVFGNQAYDDMITNGDHIEDEDKEDSPF